MFIDESGNFDFTEKGTRFFVISAFITDAPTECTRKLQDLTYEFLSTDLIDQLPFHASGNSSSTRHRVVKRLCGPDHSCEVHSIYGDKDLTYTHLRNEKDFYLLIGGAMGKYLVATLESKPGPLVLLFDSLLTDKGRNAFLKAIKPILSDKGVAYRIAFRPVKHDINGQVADYYAWSTYRWLEHNDSKWIELLPGRHTSFDLFTSKSTRHRYCMTTPPNLSVEQRSSFSGVEPLLETYH